MALPKSGKISASEIVVNFRPSSNSAPHAISEYYRGHPNGNVKDFLSNKSIPAYSTGAKELKWSDFHGTGLQQEYDWPIPNLCTDTFYLFSTAADNWGMLKDSTNEYVGRNDTSASMSIPVFNQQATISIPALKINIGSEIGEDLGYERILENTSETAKDLGLPTTTFSPGIWQMIIPKRFKRLRIMLTSGGGSGSVQKTVLVGDDLKNSATKGIVEDGYDGENSSVWGSNFEAELQGGAGGGRAYVQTESTISNPIVRGGSATTYENKSADSPTEFVVTDDVESVNGELSFNRDNIPINILYKSPPKGFVIRFDRNHSKNRPSGLGENSFFGTGGTPGIEYSYGGTPYSVGDITQVSESEFGVGGAAGQHGHRGSDVAGWTMTQSGQGGVTGYFGDFEVIGGDMINITVGTGGKSSINEYNDFAPETIGEYNTGRTDIRVSESGYGGNGVVQIIGSHGQAHSKISHAGWILEDDLGNILDSSYSRAVSSRGVTTLQGALTSPREIDVVGSNNAETPKMYRLRFSARIGKNGDIPMKTSFCHVGSKFVTVKALGKKIFLNTPSLETLYENPDSSLEVEQVTGVSKNRDTLDMEYIDNWFIEKCDIRFDLSHRGSYNNSATFTKVPSTNADVGPDSFTLNRSNSVIEFTMAARERYVLNRSNMSAPGSATSANHRLASYLRSRTQFQLDETAGDGMNSFASADMAVTYTGMGGFFLGSNNFSPVRTDKTNSDAAGVQIHPDAHRINDLNGNGLVLVPYNSNWTIRGGSIGSPKALNSTNFPDLFHDIEVILPAVGKSLYWTTPNRINNNGNPIPIYNQFSIGGGKIKELFGEDPKIIGVQYGPESRPPRELFSSRWITLEQAISNDGQGNYDYNDIAYTGFFPELVEQRAYEYFTGVDSDQYNQAYVWSLKTDWKQILLNDDQYSDHGGFITTSIYWIKDDWEDVAESMYISGGAENTTYFSCGYRGENTAGQGTTKPHTYVAPVPKKDKWWDVNITHCCTAAEKRGDMTFTEVKQLRAWHRKQSIIWQEGYDVWGKVIADHLVAKSKWQSDRVRDFYNHKVYGKRTIGSVYADIVIYPISMVVGTYICVVGKISKLFGRTKPL